MPNLLGSAPNQCPTNGDLGKLAFMDVVDTVTNNPYVDTAISDTKPSLLLDFANSKTLDPRITYTRASTATYYDGKTTAVAEQNLLTYSQDLTNAVWSKSAISITGNSTTAPDGTTTANLITADGTTATHASAQAYTASSNQKVMSFYAKAGTNNFIQLYTGTDATVYANFDLSGATVGTVGGGCTASIQSIGSGWYRCIVVTSSATSTSMALCLISSGTAVRAESSLLSTTVYVWGAQLEQRSAVSSYTPTTSSPITNYIPALQTAAAGVPRFDHDPVTGESKGFLIEEQRSNLVLYSDQFDNGNWTKYQASIIANSVVAPDGTLTGDLFIPDATSSNTHQFEQINVATAISYTATLFVKPNGYNYCMLGLGGTTSKGKYFNLSDGTVAGDWNASGASGTITPVGNGWFRITMTVTATAGSSNFLFRGYNNSSFAAFSGNGYSGIYIWGAQLEAGSFATSYIPTTSAQVTRAADAASMTGSNFSSWFNMGEGTLFFNGNASGTSYYASINDGTSSNVIQLIAGSSGTAYWVDSNGASQAGLGSRTLSAVMAAAYKVNDFSVSINGASVVTDSLGILPSSLVQLNIGARAGNSGPINGTIKKLAYYPKRLSDAELQEMTL